jgi:hypothetical protein
MIDTFIGQTLADKYRIEAVLRESGLGTVYRGTHLLMEKPVAVKILAPELAAGEATARRFSAEARAVSHLSHPNILNVTDFGTDPSGAVYIVFEDADGLTLKEQIEREGVFSAERAVAVARQIAAALSAAHLKGLVHGRLSSEAVLITPDDAVKVLDLGTYQRELAPEREISPSRIEYLAPEQCADPAAADERSDIYSTGVILFEMLAGEVPFKADNAADLMVKHAQEPPPPLSSFRHDLPPDLEPLVLQALAKNPEMRHQTAAELIDDLNRASRNLHESAGFAAAAGSAAPAINNNVWKTAFVVLAGISLLSVFLIWTLGGFEKRTDPALTTDAGSQPVQPINPATGMNETGLATIVPMSQDSMGNSNTMTAPETLGGSDGNPYWQSGTVPPGAPVAIPPGGETIQMGDSNSPFTQDEPGTIYRGNDGKLYMIVPPAANANTSTNVQPATTPRTGRTPANTTAQPQTSPTPNQTPAPETKPTAQPAPAKTPVKPTEQPKTTPSSAKPAESGKTQDSE